MNVEDVKRINKWAVALINKYAGKIPLQNEAAKAFTIDVESCMRSPMLKDEQQKEYCRKVMLETIAFIDHTDRHTLKQE